MYIVAIAWLFVAVLMGASEAMSTSIVGGFLTFFFYGLVPLTLVLYLFGIPQRRRDRRKREQADELLAAVRNPNKDSSGE